MRKLETIQNEWCKWELNFAGRRLLLRRLVVESSQKGLPTNQTADRHASNETNYPVYGDCGNGRGSSLSTLGSLFAPRRTAIIWTLFVAITTLSCHCSLPPKPSAHHHCAFTTLLFHESFSSLRYLKKLHSQLPSSRVIIYLNLKCADLNKVYRLKV